jgi:hypothetical protein
MALSKLGVVVMTKASCAFPSQPSPLAVVGSTAKWPLHPITILKTPQEVIDTFGHPVSDVGQWVVGVMHHAQQFGWNLISFPSEDEIRHCMEQEEAEHQADEQGAVFVGDGR